MADNIIDLPGAASEPPPRPPRRHGPYPRGVAGARVVPAYRMQVLRRERKDAEWYARLAASRARDSLQAAASLEKKAPLPVGGQDAQAALRASVLEWQPPDPADFDGLTASQLSWLLQRRMFEVTMLSGLLLEKLGAATEG